MDALRKGVKNIFSFSARATPRSVYHLCGFVAAPRIKLRVKTSGCLGRLAYEHHVDAPELTWGRTPSTDLMFCKVVRSKKMFQIYFAIYLFYCDWDWINRKVNKWERAMGLTLLATPKPTKILLGKLNINYSLTLMLPVHSSRAHLWSSSSRIDSSAIRFHIRRIRGPFACEALLLSHL